MDNNVYTMDDWNRDGDLKVQRGQITTDEVIDELAGAVPPMIAPQRKIGGLFQCGEPRTHDQQFVDLFATFRYIGGGLWQYVGTCWSETALVPDDLRTSGATFYPFHNGEFCGLYAAVGTPQDERTKAGDLFAVHTGPELWPVCDNEGNRINVGAELAGKSYNPRFGWYNE